METIRQLTQEDMEASYALIDFAFRRQGPTGQPLVICRPEDTWGCFVDGELASNIVIIPLKVRIHGEEHGMGLIAGVASWPEYRRNGMIRRLMLRGLESMRDAGQTLSYLGPFHYPFYRKFGYEMMYSYKSYTLKANFVPVWRGKGRVRRMKPDYAILNPVYEQYTFRYNGMLIRDEFRWNHVVTKRRGGQTAVYYNEAGVPRGYMFYELQGGQFKISEMVALDADCRFGLWDFIRKHEGAYESVTFTASADDPFSFLIENPKGLETKLVNHLMARIVDAERFLAKYRFDMRGETDEKKLRMRISDETAPWNEGGYELTIGKDGFSKVRRLSNFATGASGENEGELIPFISCGIQTLSTMFMGYQRPRFLQQCGRLEGDEAGVSLLERVLPSCTPYYIDFGY